jgi:PPOX class probable F420-dependent enzyme
MPGATRPGREPSRGPARKPSTGAPRLPIRDLVFSAAERALVVSARRAVLATVAPEGLPRLVPICFVLAERRDGRGRPILYTPLDEKPKRSPDPLRLARVEDIASRPEVTILVDRWSEDWRTLAWVRLYGEAAVLRPIPGEREEHAAAVAALRAKYRQYAGHDLDSRPVIRIAVTRVTSWGIE